MKVPLTRPYFDAADFAAVQAPLEAGWLVQGPRVAAFEKRIAGYCGVTQAVATSSCTSALHLTLLAAGVGPGDTVAVPAFTYVATANAVQHAGARPVFIDIDPQTFNIATNALQRYLEQCVRQRWQRPKVVIPVHLFGLCADMDTLTRLGRTHAFTLIEDAACALGASFKGKMPGAFSSSAACFSFHPRKIITTGEGGMIVTNNTGLARQARIQRDHGADLSDHQRHAADDQELPAFGQLGFNYRMTDIQAGLGVSQFDKLEAILALRRERAQQYDRLLGELDWLLPPYVPPGYRHTFQSYVCRLMPNGRSAKEVGMQRRKLMTYLARRNIATRPGCHAVPLLGYYRDDGPGPDACPEARMAHHSTITLPLFPQMTDQQQHHVVKALRAFGG